MQSLAKLFVISAVLLSITACKNDNHNADSKNPGTVHGTIDFDEAVELSTLTKARVYVSDTSIRDFEKSIIGELIISEFSEIPIKFSLSYDQSRFDEAGTYVTGAEAYIDDRLAFTDINPNQVLTGGFGNEANLLINRTRLVN